MDSEGWIDMATVLTFKRIKSLTTSLDLLRDTIALSPLIDLDHDRYLFRTKTDWQRWLMPGAKTHEAAGGKSQEHSASEDGDNDGTVATGTTGLTSPALSSTSKNEDGAPAALVEVPVLGLNGASRCGL